MHSTRYLGAPTALPLPSSCRRVQNAPICAVARDDDAPREHLRDRADAQGLVRCALETLRIDSKSA